MYVVEIGGFCGTFSFALSSSTESYCGILVDFYRCPFFSSPFFLLFFALFFVYYVAGIWWEFPSIVYTHVKSIFPLKSLIPSQNLRLRLLLDSLNDKLIDEGRNMIVC